MEIVDLESLKDQERAAWMISELAREGIYPNHADIIYLRQTLIMLIRYVGYKASMQALECFDILTENGITVAGEDPYASFTRYANFHHQALRANPLAARLPEGRERVKRVIEGESPAAEGEMTSEQFYDLIVAWWNSLDLDKDVEVIISMFNSRRGSPLQPNRTSDADDDADSLDLTTLFGDPSAGWPVEGGGGIESGASGNSAKLSRPYELILEKLQLDLAGMEEDFRLLGVKVNESRFSFNKFFKAAADRQVALAEKWMDEAGGRDGRIDAAESAARIGNAVSRRLDKYREKVKKYGESLTRMEGKRTALGIDVEHMFDQCDDTLRAELSKALAPSMSAAKEALNSAGAAAKAAMQGVRGFEDLIERRAEDHVDVVSEIDRAVSDLKASHVVRKESRAEVGETSAPPASRSRSGDRNRMRSRPVIGRNRAANSAPVEAVGQGSVAHEGIQPAAVPSSFEVSPRRSSSNPARRGPLAGSQRRRPPAEEKAGKIPSVTQADLEDPHEFFRRNWRSIDEANRKSLLGADKKVFFLVGFLGEVLLVGTQVARYEIVARQAFEQLVEGSLEKRGSKFVASYAKKPGVNANKLVDQLIKEVLDMGG